jgi:hypothetical protein
MEKIGYPTKNTGDQFTAAEANEIKEKFNAVAQGRIMQADYNDSGQVVPFVAGVPVSVPCDASGIFTNTLFLPDGVSLYNSADEQFDFSQLDIGDTVDIRLDIFPTLSAPNQSVTVNLVLASGTANEFRLPFITEQAYKTAGEKELLRYNGFYIGSADVRDNPAYFEFVSDGSGTLRVNGYYIRVVKY